MTGTARSVKKDTECPSPSESGLGNARKGLQSLSEIRGAGIDGTGQHQDLDEAAGILKWIGGQ